GDARVLGYEADGAELPLADMTAVDAEPGEALAAHEAAEPEQLEREPIPIDTTAELLGRAKPKRTGRAGQPPPRKTAAPRKPAPRRAARAEQPTTAEAAD